MGLEDTTEVYVRLDKWHSSWAKQYDNRQATLVRLHHARTGNIDRMVAFTDADDVQEQSRVWYSTHVHNILTPAVTFAIASQGRPDLLPQFEDFIVATQRTQHFVECVYRAKKKLGGLLNKEISQIFNYAYGGLEGYLDDEQEIMRTYPLALERAQSLIWCELEGLQEMLDYREQDSQVQRSISAIIYHGMDRHKPLISRRGTLIVGPSGKRAELRPRIIA